MKIVWAPRAVAHLVQLRQFIAKDQPDAAQSVARTIIGAVETLSKFPNGGRPGRIAGTRELVVTGTPYIIPYRVRGDRIEIVAVFHGRQKWPAQ